MTINKTMRRLLASAAVAAGIAAAPAQAAITFNFTFIPGTSAQAQAAFTRAGQRWANLFSDNVVLEMTVGTGSLPTGVIASAGSNSQLYSFNAFKAALSADRSSTDDNTAVANLAPGSSFAMLLNRTSNSPNGAGSATPFVDNDGDANNANIDVNTANAKALGLAVTAGNGGLPCLTASCDAFIQFSNTLQFDFDNTNGIDPGSFDFEGVAVHEIGHALGFVSGVDILDINSPPVNGPFRDDQFTFVSPLDLFRYSTASCTTQGGPIIDWTADTRDKFFSINRCGTQGPSFSTGQNFGDGRQASHWKDNLGIGIMDPTFARGELGVITANDVRAFDVIGWNLAQVQGAVPEPSTWAMMIAGFGVIGGAMRRRRSVKVSFA